MALFHFPFFPLFILSGEMGKKKGDTHVMCGEKKLGLVLVTQNNGVRGT